MDYTLTPEATAVVKDTGGDINALASQSMYFGVAIIFALTLAMLGVLLTKVVTANGAGDLLKGKQGLFETLKVPFIFIVLFSFFSYLGLLKFDYKFGSSGTTAPTNLQGTAVVTTTPTKTPSIPSGQSCVNPSILISDLASGKPSCSINNGGCGSICTFNTTVRNTVVSISQQKGVDYRIILALACRESSGNPNKIGKLAVNGKEDCGLLQVHSGDFGKSKCSDVSVGGKSILDLETNINLGIDTFKKKLDSVSKFSYQGITKESMAFAAYNCCSNGDNPNSRSNDCNTSTGFPYDLPKWACPINPGSSDFNMCKVKNYACDVETCSKRY